MINKQLSLRRGLFGHMIMDACPFNVILAIQWESTKDDYAKDGGEELFTKMHCVL